MYPMIFRIDGTFQSTICRKGVLRYLAHAKHKTLWEEVLSGSICRHGFSTRWCFGFTVGPVVRVFGRACLEGHVFKINHENTF